MGFVVASYAAALGGVGGLILWVWLGHRGARRELDRLERDVGE